MKPYAKRDGYVCVRMEKSGEDFNIFHTIRTQCFREKDEWDFAGVKKFSEAITTPAQSAEYWRSVFAQNKSFFVLLKGERREPIGIIDMAHSQLDNKPCATLETLHILKAHREHHLSDVLFQGALSYIARETEYPFVMAQIDHTNGPSIACSARHGFISDGSEVYRTDLKRSLLIFMRAVDDLRAPTPAPITAPVPDPGVP